MPTRGLERSRSAVRPRTVADLNMNAAPAAQRSCLANSSAESANAQPTVAPGAHQAIPAGQTTPQQITVIVFGDQKVGKTAIVSQFLWAEFVEDYCPTVEEFHWIEYEVGEDRRLTLQVIDSGGSRDFLAMRHLYIGNGDAFMVVFAVNDPESFEEAKKIIAEILETKRQVPILLVANKTDLYENEMKWEVKNAREYALNNDFGMASISAKNKEEVCDAFRNLLENLRGGLQVKTADLRKRRQSMPAATGRALSNIDVQDLKRLEQKHKQKHNNCCLQ